MTFSKHLFISYTHDDNATIPGRDEGWVSLFHETLGKLLPPRLGEPVVIWRDNKLAGNDEFAMEIMDQFAQVATMVCVLSPKYLNSKWCKDEAEAFCRAASCATGIAVGNKSRIFKVIKLPVSNQPEGLPEEFGKATGFPFYRSKDDVPFELDPAYGADMIGEFNKEVAILAQKLAETLIALKQAGQPLAPAQEKKGTIFLAETSWDRDSDRKRLEAELSGRGYQVLPDRDLPAGEDACLDEIKKALAGCDMAIHLIGNQQGMVPRGPTQKSVDELQNEMAADQSDARGIPRVIWVPADTQSKVDSHAEFLRLLNKDDHAQRGADVVKGDFEVLKGAVLQALQKVEQKKTAPQPEAAEAGPDRTKLIYVICDKRDSKVSVDLREQLNTRGFEPRRPLFDGDAASVRQQNDAMLAQCGLVVLFYGAADKEWYDNTRIDIEKSNTRAPVWTYLAAPCTAHKELLLDKLGEEGPVINGMSGPPPKSELDRMLSDMPKAADAGGQSK